MTYLPPPPQDEERIFGPTYRAPLDQKRLQNQTVRVRSCLYQAARRGEWLTLEQMQHRTGDPTPSISAQIRHLRKPQFGSHIIRKRRREEPQRGIWEYQLQVPW